MRYEKFIPGILQYKLSFQLDEDFKKLNINQRSNKLTDSTLTKSYLAPLTISFNKKKKDLISLLPLINPELHSFYHNLKVDGECEIEIEVDADLDEENYLD